MRMLIIANPLSGKGAAKRVMPKVKDFFNKNYIETDIYFTKGQNDATIAAKNAMKSGRYDIMVASGGDGTVNEVVNGIVGVGQKKKVKFGIIPLGTENVLAQETGIPFDPIKASSVIMGMKSRKMDVGRANGRYFVLMAGIGFDAHVATKVEPLLKKLIGSAAYQLTAWNELFNYKHSELEITIDGHKRVKGSYVVIGNTKLYGAKLKITHLANIYDGLLDVCIFKGKDVFSFIRFALGAMTRQHLRLGDIEYHKAKNVLIKSRPKALCHVDCEVIGTTPINIEVVPKAIDLIVP